MRKGNPWSQNPEDWASLTNHVHHRAHVMIKQHTESASNDLERAHCQYTLENVTYKEESGGYMQNGLLSALLPMFCLTSVGGNVESGLGLAQAHPSLIS